MAEYLDLENNTVIAGNVAPAVRTTADDTNGTTVDLLNYRYCTFIGSVGVEGDTLGASVEIELGVEESDDNSSWSDVANADLTTYVTGDNVGAFGHFDADTEIPAVVVTTYKGSSRYVRATVTMDGTHSTGTPSCVISIKHGAKVLPAS